MNRESNAVLRHPMLNGWNLFWLVALPLSVMMLVELQENDLSTAAGVSHMIQFSVRWAVPFIYLVVATSALQRLFPGPIPAWLLRNRKYVGLCFAVAMAWQGLFIFLMSTVFRDYYYEEVFYLRDELEGSTGYLFLAALVVTSFRFGRSQLNARQWKLLHRAGVYFLWAYPFSVYWWNLYYYKTGAAIDYFFYWSGFLAFALRIAAWQKNQPRQLALSSSRKALASVLVLCGTLLAATGSIWQEPVTTTLLGPDWSATLSLWLPYWPFEPFLALGVLGFAALVAAPAKTSQHTSTE